MSDKPFLFVLGMHRSGTSALAGVINRLGFNAGSAVLEPQEDNPQGFWENSSVVEVHNSILRDIGSSWDDPVDVLLNKRGDEIRDRYIASIRKVLKEEFAGIDLPYLKDPRLCQFFGMWQPLLEDLEWSPRCLIIIRDPLEVAESLMKRNNMDGESAILLWLKANLNICAQTHGLRRYILSYDRLLNGTNKELAQALTVLGYAEPGENVMMEATGYIDRSQRHNKGVGISYDQCGVYGAMAEKIYQSIMLLANGSEDPDQKLFEEIGQQLEKYESISKPWIQSRARMSDNSTSYIKQCVEDAYQTLINEKVDVSNAVHVSDSVSVTEAMLDELVTAVRDRVEQAETRVQKCEAERDAYSSELMAMENELANCKASLTKSHERISENVIKPARTALEFLVKTFRKMIGGK